MANIEFKTVGSVHSKPDKKCSGIAETAFKDCFRYHTRDFCHKNYVKSTELSKYIWKFKDEKTAPTIMFIRF